MQIMSSLFFGALLHASKVITKVTRRRCFIVAYTNIRFIDPTFDQYTNEYELARLIKKSHLEQGGFVCLTEVKTSILHLQHNEYRTDEQTRIASQSGRNLARFRY